jgi:hypothetical protein
MAGVMQITLPVEEAVTVQGSPPIVIVPSSGVTWRSLPFTDIEKPPTMGPPAGLIDDIPGADT